MILILGCAGFVGSAIAREYLTSNKLVLGIDNYDSTLYDSQIKRKNVDELKEFKNFSFMQIDLSKVNIKTILSEFNVDTVINQAAVPGLVPSWKSFNSYVNSNVVATKNILDALVGSDIFLIHASTSSVYGKLAKGDENSILSPSSPYGVTKLAAENLINTYALNYNVRATILRYFSVYGPGQRPDMAYSKFINSVLKNNPITIYGDGTQSRTNTYISDIVAATKLAAEKKLSGEVFNISGDEAMKLSEVLGKIFEIMDKKVPVKKVQASPGDQIETQGNSKKAYIKLGWQAKINIETGLRDQIEHAMAVND